MSKRMLYTLAGAAKATGLDSSMILRAIEDGRITGIKDLLDEWQVQDSELHHLYPPITESEVHTDSPCAAPDATTLETEIGALITEAGDGLREQRDEGLGDAPTIASISDHDIRVLDRDKILLAASPPRLPQARTALIAGALLMTLGIGWVGGLSSHHLLWGLPAVEQKLSPSARISAAENQTTMCVSPDKTAREAAPSGATTGKIATATGSGIGRRHASTPSIAQAATAVTNSTSAGAQQNGATAEPATAAIRRRANALSRPMPVPETKPSTIEGWTVRDVVDGTAVLEGPDGTWKAARGDMVPGLGRVDSIVRWGNRWIVATRKGLITTQ
jgi:hypothetical protein